ncbi:MAG TPA: hypothetical protein VHZ50_13070 [Puia sp.]|nr:hypothetical protein [Puia sp.]
MTGTLRLCLRQSPLNRLKRNKNKEVDFLKIKEHFEEQFNPIELLELNYSRYAFGSGWVVYRVKGKNLKLKFDGRDSILRILISSKHAEYPTKDESEIFEGSYAHLINNYEKINTELEK